MQIPREKKKQKLINSPPPLPFQVSLDSRVREIVVRNMVDPSAHTFDEAQLQIYTLMHRDSYPRFVNSSYYKKLAQFSNTSRKESSA